MSGIPKPTTVMVVDDVPANINVVAGILKPDYRVKVATSGERALKIINTPPPPDLILLDIMMPVMDGFEVCERVKQNPDTREIPIIFLSAIDEDQAVLRGLRLGAVDYVVKPPAPEILKARVGTHIRLRREKQLVVENAALREDVERITRHDLKNPLGVITGYAAMLAEDESLEEVHRESARMMAEAAYNMLNIINNSLNLYKIEQGTYALDPKPMELVKLIERCIGESKVLAQNLGVVIEFTAHARDTRALGEELLTYSLLNNLLRNAVEASPAHGRVRVSLQEGEWVQILIHNEGTIPEAIREHFFDKYVTSGKRGGSGLGTYSARLLTEVQGGEIGFESSESAGTTLRVCMPSL